MYIYACTHTISEEDQPSFTIKQLAHSSIIKSKYIKYRSMLISLSSF